MTTALLLSLLLGVTALAWILHRKSLLNHHGVRLLAAIAAIALIVNAFLDPSHRYQSLLFALLGAVIAARGGLFAKNDTSQAKG